jgi:1-acyl-sn-glycerol-3-phosphate acyltransferase
VPDARILQFPGDDRRPPTGSPASDGSDVSVPPRVRDWQPDTDPNAPPVTDTATDSDTPPDSDTGSGPETGSNAAPNADPEPASDGVDNSGVPLTTEALADLLTELPAADDLAVAVPYVDRDHPPAYEPEHKWEHKAAGLLSFVRRRLAGQYEIDDFGYDRDLTENLLLPALRPVYRKWFRVETAGIANIPADGGALVVANHAGGLWALDAAMTAVAIHDEHPEHRQLRMLGADLVFTTPVLGTLARKAGSTLACNEDAERMLNAGELVGVWPEGFKGIGKPFAERYKLQRFGRGGFVSAALRTGVPIIPVSIVGSEEIHPVIGNVPALARLLGLPYFPLTPTFPWLGPLGLVPLPSKWHIEFAEPIETASFGADAAEDPMLVFDLTDRVRETIQSGLYRMLEQRTSIWR